MFDDVLDRKKTFDMMFKNALVGKMGFLDNKNVILT